MGEEFTIIFVDDFCNVERSVGDTATETESHAVRTGSERPIGGAGFQFIYLFLLRQMQASRSSADAVRQIIQS